MNIGTCIASVDRRVLRHCHFAFEARGVHTYLENPAGSMIFSYGKTILVQLPFLAAAILARCRFTPDEPVKYKKSYKFLLSGPWLPQSPCVCDAGTHQALVKADPARQKYTGLCGHLRASQSYPWLLGEEIIFHWERISSGPPAFAATASATSSAAFTSVVEESSAEGGDAWAALEPMEKKAVSTEPAAKRRRPVPQHLEGLVRCRPLALPAADDWADDSAWEVDPAVPTCTGDVPTSSPAVKDWDRSFQPSSRPLRKNPGKAPGDQRATATADDDAWPAGDGVWGWGDTAASAAEEPWPTLDGEQSAW